MTTRRGAFVVRAMDEVPVAEVDRASGATMQVLLGPEQGVPRFYTRRFTLAPGGRIPAHSHDRIEHEQVVLEGEMVLTLDDEVVVARAGDCLYIPAGVVHSYRNEGERPVRFLCMVPATADYQTTWADD